jgi:hypothetical protein
MTTKKMIGEYSEGHLLKTASDVVMKKTKNSVLLDSHAESKIPKFDMDGTIPNSFHALPIAL